MLTVFKGSKGGGGSDFTQTPDNLRSEDTFEGLMGMCIGPIKGPTNGLKSVKLDGTAIQNETGDSNFPGFVAVLSNGDPTAFPVPITLRLGAAAAPTAINVNLVNPPAGSSVWVTRTLANTSPDYIDLRFIVQQLYSQTKSGIFGTTATIEVQLKPTGMTNWINPTVGSGSGTTHSGGKTAGVVKALFAEREFTNISDDPDVSAGTASNFVIRGKTTSPAVFELRIWVPTEGAYSSITWDVRCRLIEKDTLDADPNFAKRTISWESIAAVYADTLGEEEDWRGVSWLQFYGKASDQLAAVPEVEVEADTKIVSVPPLTVYNPDTRAYTATLWDGSWAKAYTNDPAWVINDVLSDELSGLSLLAPGSYLNKWDALEASKWFSELVDDGAGGSHPRYSLNVVANQQMKAEDLVRYLAGAVGGFAWDEGNGEWRMKVDKPDTPVDLFTLENIESEFVYSHTDVDTRFNDYTGTFLNAEFDYREDTVHIFDNDSIALIGHKPTSIALIGCTSRQEGLRRLMVRMRSSVNETRMVTFTTNRRGRNVEQLDMILVADGHLGDQAAHTTGRTVTIAADRLSVTVRDALRVELGVAYKLKFGYLNPNYNPAIGTQPTNADWKKPTVVAERNVTNSAGQRGSVTTIYLDTALPTGLPEHLAVALEAVDLPTIPRLYRVINVGFEDDGERVSISAMEVDGGKWYAADHVSSVDTVFQDLRGVIPMPLLPPDNDLLKVVVTPADQGTNVNLIATWTRPPGANVSGFRVTYSVNDGQEIVLTEKTSVATAEIVNPPQGTYTFNVYTIGRNGQRSVPLTATQIVDQSTISAAEIVYNDGTPLEEGRSRTVNGASTVNVPYDYTGTTIDSTFDLQYTLVDSTGTLTTGVTAIYQVTDGTLNGFNSTSGPQTMTVVSGGATLPVTTLATDSATVQVTMVTGGVSYPKTVVFTKVKAAPPVDDPGTGGGGFPQSQTSAFTQLVSPWTSFAAMIGRLQLTMPTGKTTARITIALNPKWQPKVGQPNWGDWNIEFKVQRNTGTTGSPIWTDIGTTQNSNPDPYIDDEPDTGFIITHAGTMSYTFDDTGRTAGNTYEYQVVARVSAGTVAGNTGGINYTGSVALTAP